MKAPRGFRVSLWGLFISFSTTEASTIRSPMSKAFSALKLFRYRIEKEQYGPELELLNPIERDMVLALGLLFE